MGSVARRGVVESAGWRWVDSSETVSLGEVRTGEDKADESGNQKEMGERLLSVHEQSSKTSWESRRIYITIVEADDVGVVDVDEICVSKLNLNVYILVTVLINS